VVVSRIGRKLTTKCMSSTLFKDSGTQSMTVFFGGGGLNIQSSVIQIMHCIQRLVVSNLCTWVSGFILNSLVFV
jgi:hypothetical protein